MPFDAMSTLTKEQLEERLVALHRASLDLVRDISLESLLKRIATLACEQAKARYAAVGVLGVNGELEQFITIGMSPAELARMAHPPVGRGLIGVLMRSKTALRVPDIGDDPRSAGFPAHHPAMKSLLGVPIRLGNEALGQIYLTDKTDGGEFSDADQLIIEMLASYAAVAISNARLYRELIQRDRVLTRRNENLALLNTMASTMSTFSTAWITSPMNRFLVPSIPERSASAVNAVGIPMAERVAGRVYFVSMVNFGKYTITRWVVRFCCSPFSHLAESDPLRSARSPSLGRRIIMERCLPESDSYGIRSTWRSPVSM